MNKSIRKILIVSLIVVLSTISLAACSKKPSENNVANTNSSSGGAHTAPFKDGKFDPVVTMTLVTEIKSDASFKEGESIEDNVHTRWVRENLGIDMKYLWTTTGGADAFNTKLRLTLSANEKMPDVIPVNDMVLAGELIDSGKFMEVGDLFEKYASDSFKRAMNEDPTVWYPVMRDGKKYGLPTLDYTGNSDPVLYIRTDWLEKLKLEAPKTIDELEKVMDAFVNQDPDGNNQNDTYGLTFGLKNGFKDWVNVSWVFGAYGVIPEQWNDLTGSGALKYGSIQPQMKDGLTKLKEWMDKGYVHREVGLWDATKSTELFTAGKVGMVAGPLWMPFWPLADVMENVPGATFKAFPIPVGPNGKAMRMGSLNFGGVVLISKDMQNPDALFEYFNNLYDNYADPNSTSDQAYGLAEGYDWMEKDGEILIESELPDFKRVLSYTITGNGARFPSAYLDTIAALADGKKPETPYEVNKAAIPFESLLAGKVVLSQPDITLREEFIGAPTATMKSRGDSLKTMEKETLTKIIYGDLPFSEFDKFVEKWKSSGGDKMTEEVNEWFKTLK